MNSKDEERRKRARTHRRREERRRERWESFPQRILRKVDEEWPYESMADAVDQEVLWARPTRADLSDLLAEILRLRSRYDAIEPGTGFRAARRLWQEINVLEYAYTAASFMVGGEDDE